MKQVIVIGSGNAFNSSGRAHPCFLLESVSGSRLLLDAGATALYILQRQKIDLSALDCMLISHYHGDHFLGLPFILLQMQIILKRKQEFTILGPPGLSQVCQQLMDIAYPGFNIDFKIIYQEIHDKEYQAGDFSITPFPVLHRPESLGFRISGPSGKTVAYTGDTGLNDNVFVLVENVDLAIIEMSLLKQEDPPVPHIALDEIISRRSELKARKIVFSHLYNDVAAEITRLNLGEVAEDGKIFLL